MSSTDSIVNKNAAIFQIINEINFIINCTMTVITFYLIKKINNRNGYAIIVKYLTICQLIFEFGSLIYNRLPTEIYYLVRYFFVLISGMMSSFYAFLICFILSYVVLTRKYFDISYQLNKINFFFLVFAFVLNGLGYYFEKIDEKDLNLLCFSLYNWIRIIIPFLIIFILLYVKYVMYQMKLFVKHPINILFKKLCIYPLVAIISRLPVWYYQFKYNKSTQHYKFTLNPSNLETLLYLIALLTYPSAGIIILIILQTIFILLNVLYMYQVLVIFMPIILIILNQNQFL